MASQSSFVVATTGSSNDDLSQLLADAPARSAGKQAPQSVRGASFIYKASVVTAFGVGSASAGSTAQQPPPFVVETRTDRRTAIESFVEINGLRPTVDAVRAIVTSVFGDDAQVGTAIDLDPDEQRHVLLASIVTGPRDRATARDQRRAFYAELAKLPSQEPMRHLVVRISHGA